MSENISKYEIIKNKIEEQISQGFYKENDKIPSENELCRAFASSRITVRKALDELVTTGVLYRQQGIGTFVKPKTVEVSADVDKVLLILPNYPELFAAGISQYPLHFLVPSVLPTGDHEWNEECGILFILESGFFYVLCQEEWYKESPGGFKNSYP